jgi:ABC-type branched-subunit amino acid transport system ATPase component
LLLVDEPSAGVSLAHVREFERVTLEEAARGCSVVVVDHDLEFVSRVASRVVVLDAGRMIFEGTPERAFADPAVVQAYIGVSDD